jgi:hypothetical protein
MSANYDRFPGFAGRQIPIEGRTTYLQAALGHYGGLLAAPERLHAACEDYRAGARIGRRLDEVAIGTGRRIACPTLVVSASHCLTGSPLASWRARCSGAGFDSDDNFLAEENPHGTCSSPSNRRRPAHVTGDEDAREGEA